VATGATVIGPFSATGASVVQLFDSSFTGPVSVEGGSTRVAVSGTRVVGPLRIAGNSTGGTPIVLTGTTVIGPLACTGNSPAPVNLGRTNSVTGPATGQCAGM
jgi:hypothetical protein